MSRACSCSSLAVIVAALMAVVAVGCVKMDPAKPVAEAPAAVAKTAPAKMKAPAPAAEAAAVPVAPAPRPGALKVASAKTAIPTAAGPRVATAQAVAPNAPSDGKAPKAHVAEPEADLGDIKRGETGQHTFVIKNNGTDVLRIKRAKGT